MWVANTVDESPIWRTVCCTTLLCHHDLRAHCSVSTRDKLCWKALTQLIVEDFRRDAGCENTWILRCQEVQFVTDAFPSHKIVLQRPRTVFCMVFNVVLGKFSFDVPVPHAHILMVVPIVWRVAVRLTHVTLKCSEIDPSNTRAHDR